MIVTTTNIHNVKSISIGDKHFTNDPACKFWSKTITIKTAEGGEISISLFSEEQLEIQHENSSTTA